MQPNIDIGARSALSGIRLACEIAIKMKNASLYILLGLIPALASGATVQLITNGDFETGSFAGWTAVSQAGSDGNLYIDAPGTTTPYSSSSTAANPGGGSFYAVTDQGGPGTYALIQSFTFTSIPTSAVLTFDMFANSYGGFSVHPDGLEHNSSPNQHARVDLLSGSAGAFDTGAGVLANFFLGVDSGTNPNPYTSYSFDITSLITSPGTYQLRFAQVDNQGFFNMGVDNVSLLSSDESAVPEPSNIVLLGALFSGGLLFRNRRGRCGCHLG